MNYHCYTTITTAILLLPLLYYYYHCYTTITTAILLLHMISREESLHVLQGKRVGIFRKDYSEFTGPLVEGWRKTVKETNMSEVGLLLFIIYLFIIIIIIIIIVINLLIYLFITIFIKNEVAMLLYLCHCTMFNIWTFFFVINLHWSRFRKLILFFFPPIFTVQVNVNSVFSVLIRLRWLIIV